MHGGRDRSDGRGKDGPVEVTGWLPVVASMDALAAAVPQAGPPKSAVQEGRRIATLKRGVVPKLTGTIAFLSDGAGKLF